MVETSNKVSCVGCTQVCDDDGEVVVWLQLAYETGWQGKTAVTSMSTASTRANMKLSYSTLTQNSGKRIRKCRWMYKPFPGGDQI